MSEHTGILAYGSLIDCPREEIRDATTEVIKDGVLTPFHVEFARKSGTREEAPTLVPVTQGGSQVRAQIFVLNVPEEEAANRLYRREIDKVGDKTIVYKHPENPGENQVVIKRLENFHGLKVVLYTAIGANIQDLTPETLAEHAIASARKLNNGKDGITYLINAKKNGIVTPLSDGYEEAIKCLTESQNLTEALRKVRLQSEQTKRVQD